MLIPLLFMGDIVGRLFREFAVTLAVTILVSAVVSLTLTPMMCAKLLRHQPESQQTWFYRKSEKMFQRCHRVLRAYAAVRTAFPHDNAYSSQLRRWSAPFFSISMCPKGFFPVQDTGVILGVSQAPQNISFAAMSTRQQQLADVILSDPAVESLSSFIGIDGTNTTQNSGRIQINLKPLEQRKISASDVIRRLQPEAGQAQRD